MKKVLSLAAIVLATVVPTFAARAQTSDGHAPSTADKAKNVAPLSGSADASKKSEAKNDPKKTAKAEKKKKSEPKKSDSKKVAESSSTASAAPINGTDATAATSDAPAKMPATSVPVSAPVTNTPDPPKATPPATPAPAPALMNIYRVGIGDVLDVRLLNAPTTNQSTLFTVLAGGLLEYPLAGEPVAVAGLTTEEINMQLTPKIKLYDNPRLAVSVREYASHHVIVTGLVNDPGTKVLRREAVPLYVVLAEAQPRAEAARASIMRQGGQSLTIDLSDSTATSALVLAGDVIRLTAAPPPQPQFFYIGGQVNAPGQKDFHKGLTLMQAVLASGGTSRFASDEVKVMRQGADGKLVTTRYNLKKIEEGKIPDPSLQAGDRIEVSRGGW
jgi:polysaccharide export outer membrane protein